MIQQMFDLQIKVSNPMISSKPCELQGFSSMFIKQTSFPLDVVLIRVIIHLLQGTYGRKEAAATCASVLVELLETCELALCGQYMCYQLLSWTHHRGFRPPF